MNKLPKPLFLLPRILIIMPFCVNCGSQNINDPELCPECGRYFSGKPRKKKRSQAKRKSNYDDFVISTPPKKKKSAAMKNATRSKRDSYKSAAASYSKKPKSSRSSRDVVRRQKVRPQMHVASTPPPKQTYSAPRQSYSQPRRAPQPAYNPQPRPAYNPQPRQTYQQPRQNYNPQPKQTYQQPRQPQAKRQTPPRSTGRPPVKEDPTWKKVVQVGIVMIIFILLMSFMILNPGTLDEFNVFDNFDPNMRVFPKEAEFEVKRILTVSADTTISQYTVKASTPQEIPPDGSLQHIVQFTKDPQETYRFPNRGNNEVLIWQKNNFQGSDKITLYYHVKATTYDWDLDAKSSGSIADIDPAYVTRYTADEWPVVDDYGAPVDFDGDGIQDTRYNPSNSRIQQLALEAKGDKENVYEIVSAIYEYIVDNFAYPTQAQMNEDNPKNWNLPKCPLATIRDGRGDCDDQSFLFCSMCRAVGIPAWLELGALYDSMKGAWTGHGWANVYIPLNAGGEAICTVDCVNQEFLFRDCYRYTDWEDIGGDIEVMGESKNNLDYYYHLFSSKGGKTRAGADIDELFVKVSFQSTGIVNKAIDGPGSEFISNGLEQTDQAGYELPVFIGVFLIGSLVCLTISRSRRK